MAKATPEPLAIPALRGFLLDGEGSAAVLEPAQLADWSATRGPLIVLVDLRSDEGNRWLQGSSGLDSLVIEALQAKESRPRATMMGGALMVSLRGVNLNPGANPADMISVRMWVDGDRLIVGRALKVMALASLAEQLAAGHGPKNTGEALATIAKGLAERAGPAIAGLDDECDRLETELLTRPARRIRSDLADLRRRSIGLRRYLAPQREALARVHADELPWLDVRSKAWIREAADQVIRYVEDLDEVRDRAAVVQDELMNVQSEQMNRTMYLLSMVATIMLPLGFVTGLLGINVGGMPGVDSPMAFTLVCAVLVVVGVLEVVAFRRMRLL